jgi:hypothetical protein
MTGKRLALGLLRSSLQRQCGDCLVTQAGYSHSPISPTANIVGFLCNESAWDHRLPARAFSSLGAAPHSSPSVSAIDPLKRAWRSAPKYASYVVEVEITAFEDRYVDAAANTIQDLFLINFAPKVMPGNKPQSPASMSGLQFGAQTKRIGIDWKRSRFTVIRGVRAGFRFPGGMRCMAQGQLHAPHPPAVPPEVAAEERRCTCLFTATRSKVFL